MDLIRQIHKDRGDWFFYEVNFRQAMQNDDTLSWSYEDQILHIRALNRSKNAVVSTSIKPFQNQAPCKTCHKFNWGGTAMEYVATSTPAIIAGETIQCPRFTGQEFKQG